MIKLIASDMDGTLLNNKLQISEENAHAIKQAQSEGILFLAATGRDDIQVRPLLMEHGIVCPIIALNGAKVYDEKGKELLSHPLPKQTVTGVMKMLEEAGIHLEMVTSSGTLSNNKQKRLEAFAAYLQETDPSLSFEQAVEIAAEEADTLKIRFVPSYRSVLENNETVYKLSAYTEQDPAILVPLKEKLLQKLPDLTISSFHPSNLEITHHSAQKGTILAEFAESRGISSKESMAIGDNLNDLSMLKWATHSVAMMNGLPIVKETARHLTASNQDNGVALAIQKFLSPTPL